MQSVLYDRWVCPRCRATLDSVVEGWRCSRCEVEYPRAPWGLSFLPDAREPLETSEQIAARDREAREYEDAQLLHKGRPFWDLAGHLIHAALRHAPEGPFLDAGCGTGFITEALASPHRDLLALDLSQASLRVLAEKTLPRTLPLHGDLTALPLADQSLAGIACSLVVQHLSPELRARVYSEFRRCLAPQGVLALSAYNVWHFHIRHLPTEGRYDSGIPYTSFTARQFEEELVAAGFEAVKVRPLGWASGMRLRRGLNHLLPRCNALLNRLEGALHSRLPRRSAPSDYWLLTARQPAPQAAPVPTA